MRIKPLHWKKRGDGYDANRAGKIPERTSRKLAVKRHNDPGLVQSKLNTGKESQSLEKETRRCKGLEPKETDSTGVWLVNKINIENRIDVYNIEEEIDSNE